VGDDQLALVKHWSRCTSPGGIVVCGALIVLAGGGILIASEKCKNLLDISIALSLSCLRLVEGVCL
jgi:hypothetical protein